jgi:uncharacterized cofD-like protein
MKKVVVLGGGTGLSVLLHGLKQFPLDITAVVSVADSGGSSGILRNEFNIPAMGDLRNVLVSLSEVEPLVEKLLQYRFKTNSDLNNHPIGNLLLTALVNITGNAVDAVSALGSILNLKGTVLPLTCDSPTLIAITEDNKKLIGEAEIDNNKTKIKSIAYDKEPKIVPEVLNKIKEADLIVFGIGSLYTSLIPNILSEEIKKSIINSKAKKMYITNIMSELGDTDGFNVSDCINLINKYMNKEILDVVISNNGTIEENIKKRYLIKDGSKEIKIDKENLKNFKGKLIEDDLVLISNEKDIHNPKIKDDMIRHDPIKTAFHIFSYLLDK